MTKTERGPVETVDDGLNGVQGPIGTFPTTSNNRPNYFRDIGVVENFGVGIGSFPIVNAQAITAAGFSYAEALYLLRHRISQGMAEAENTATAAVLHDIRDRLAHSGDEANGTSSVSAEPSEAVRRELTLLRWHPQVINEVLEVLGEQRPIVVDLNILPAGVTLPINEVPYVWFKDGQLIATKILTTDHKNTLKALSSNSAFQGAIDKLYEAPVAYVVRDLAWYEPRESSVASGKWPVGQVFPPELANRVYYDVQNKHLHFVGPMDDGAYARLLAMVKSLPDAAELTQNITELRKGYSSLPSRDIRLINENEWTQLRDDLRDPSRRFLFLFSKLLPYRERVQSSRTVQEKLAGATGLQATTVGKLLNGWLTSSGESGKGLAIDDFLDPAFIQSSVALPVTPDRFPNQFKSYRRLVKVASLVSKFRLSDDALGWLFGPMAIPGGWLNPNRLPTGPDESPVGLMSLLRMANLFRLRDSIPGGEATLKHIFAMAVDETRGPVLLERLSMLTAWNLDDLKSLTGPTGFNYQTEAALKAAFKDEILLLLLVDCFAVIKRLGATAEQCLRWSKVEIGLNEAAEIKRLARSRHSDASWREVTKPLRDVLREKQRQALVAHLIAKHQFRDSNDLYGHYLIDVEMSPCAMTTRMKQACASLQLFAQRCLLNLEPEVPPGAIDTQVWSWMKNYRVWEANRKVFLYPENWIEPELRDDKSEFFQQLESELLQSNVTHEAALDAFQSYSQKVGMIARITVISTAVERKEDGFVTHVLGRDGSTPYRYFYRQWRLLVSSNDGYPSAWTAWEEVNVGIDSNHVLMYVLAGSVRIAWPSITSEGASPRMKISINVVQRQSKGWSAPKRGSGYLWWVPPPNIDDSRGLQFGVKYLSSGDVQIICMGAIFREGVVPRPINFDISTPFKFDESNQGGRIEALALVRYKDNYAREHHWIAKDTMIWSVLTGLAPDLRTFVFSRLGYEQGDLYQTPGLTSQVRWIIQNALSVEAPSHYRKPSQISQIIDLRDAGRFSWSGDFVLDVLDVSSLNYINVNPERDLEFSQLGAFALNQAGAVTVLEGSQGDSLPTILFQDAQVFNSNFREKAGRGIHDKFSTPKSELLKATPGRFLAGQLVGQDAFFYTDDKADLLFWRFIPIDILPYQIIPISAWWSGELSSRIEQEQFAQVAELQYRRAPREQWLKVGSGADRAESTTTLEIPFEDKFPFSTYNWETFFHIPILVATQLMQNQRFEEAQRWFHLVFDPTSEESGNTAQKYWKFKPFRDEGPGKSIEEELLALAGGDKSLVNLIERWRRNPFRPHLIARTRHRAYQLFVVRKYLDNLIAWGDQLFRRDTIESINEATQLYILASEILGRRPRPVPRHRETSLTFFHPLYPGLESGWDSFGNALVQVESLIPPVGGVGKGEGVSNPPVYALYFCIPRNEHLADYWNVVEDRLFKIRHCMNIEGVERQLPLYEPPIDPAILVRAAAAGVDLSSVLNDLHSPLPRYRFSIMAQRAQEVLSDVKSLGAALLSAVEKQDAESLALLRSTQEMAMLKLVTSVREGQLDEANATVAVLRKTREVAAHRYQYYQRLLGKANIELPAENASVSLEATPGKAVVTRDIADPDLAGIGLSKSESDHLGWMNDANNFTVTSGAFQTASGIAYAFPQITVKTPFADTQHGGMNVGSALGAVGSFFNVLASNASFQANRASTIGGHQRRYDEWALQSNLAAKELEQIDKQIAAAELRAAIAERELSNHQQQIENAQAVDAFMRDKFSNAQLYRWMSGQISGLYFRAYQLAYDLARRAEKAYRHELALEDKDSNFIQFGYWDSLKRGLLAGEKLSFDIKRMEAAYLEKNKREFEITKHVSLRQLDPVALLTLKATGTCELAIPEWLYDLDGPGHYLRRIKTVSLSIPAVTGPYTSLSCTLSLQSSSVRKSPLLKNDKYTRQAGEDNRFVDYFGMIESVVTSSGTNDSGLFETNLHDERFLPFEGAGAISHWIMKLPDPHGYPTFSYATISDIILHIRYTARQGVQPDKVQEALDEVFKTVPRSDLSLLFSLRYDFPIEWAAFLNGAEAFTATIRRDYFPYFIARPQGKALTVKGIELYDGKDVTKHQSVGDPGGATTDLATKQQFVVTTREPVLPRVADADVFLVIYYSLSS